LELEKWIRSSTKCTEVRLAVVDKNPVESYWLRMGFRYTGEQRPHEGATVRSVKRIMTKKLSRERTKLHDRHHSREKIECWK
jgi:hypothetical protein